MAQVTTERCSFGRCHLGQLLITLHRIAHLAGNKMLEEKETTRTAKEDDHVAENIEHHAEHCTC